jgi:hypothetical protein
MNIVVKTIGLLVAFGVSYFVSGKLVYGKELPKPPPVETQKTQPKAACASGTEVQKILSDKGYFFLLEMKNDQSGVVEQLWSGGKDMVISIAKDDMVCVVSSASETTYNPQTIEKIYNVFKKSQKDL